MPSSRYDPSDIQTLDKDVPLSQKLIVMHSILCKRYPDLDHISVIVYDNKTDTLKTFLDTDPPTAPLKHYQAKLSESESLSKMVNDASHRVINDLSRLTDSKSVHATQIQNCGFLSSYTIPMFYRDKFYGFIFFNSKQPEFFVESVLSYIDQFARLLSLIVIFELTTIKTLSRALRTTRELINKRDCETGAHLERMSRFSRLIAIELAGENNLSDEYIEHLYLFSTLHDIGKISIPDSILLKPGPLDKKEYATMKTHTTIGLNIIDRLLTEFELTELPYVEVLRNVVLHHHEAMDGTGYPHGLSGEDIPLEARIVTTADIFDALTSRRPYKPAWSNDATITEMRQISGSKLDPMCVEALIRNHDHIKVIQEQFVESVYG